MDFVFYVSMDSGALATFSLLVYTSTCGFVFDFVTAVNRSSCQSNKDHSGQFYLKTPRKNNMQFIFSIWSL